MKIDSIKIGYVDVPLFEDDLDDDECFGYFESYPDPKICLHHTLSPLYKGATAFHEVIEAISAIYGLDLSENQVRTLETSIVDIVRDNPNRIREWINLLNYEDTSKTTCTSAP